MSAKKKIEQPPGVMLAVETSQRPVVVAPILLTPKELAARLNVPETWIREKTRKRARLRDKDALPTIRLGKYCRFDWEAVAAWLGRQSSDCLMNHPTGIAKRGVGLGVKGEGVSSTN